MPERFPRPVFLDATVISNFASTGEITYLAELLESPVVVTAVRDEIERGLTAGHAYLDTAVDSFGEELTVIDVPPEVEDTSIRGRLDAGETESILGVIAHGGTVATDDLAARRVADSRNIPVTGSV